MRCAHTLTTLATVAWATALPAADSSHSLAPDGAGWQRMEPSVPHVAHSGWESAGRCSGTELLNVTFFLKHSAEQARLMQDRLLAVSDPASKTYGQHLTREGVARLAATPEAAARVRTYLLDGGVLASQMRMGATRDSLTLASVSCGQLERLLSTTLHQYTHPMMRPIIRTSAAYHLPAHVADHVAVVAPLARFPTRRVHERSSSGQKLSPGVQGAGARGQQLGADGRAEAGLPRRPSDSGAPSFTENGGVSSGSEVVWPTDCGDTCAGSDMTGRYTTPEVLATQYSLGDAPGQGARGSMAVAEWEGEMWTQVGLDYYASQCSLEDMSIDTQVGANLPSMCTEGLVDCTESMMDIELIKAVGGGVPLTVIFAMEYSIELWALALNDMVDGELPLVHSVSYGDDEVQQTLDAPTGVSGAEYMDAIDLEFVKLGLRGVSILVASGDQGVWGRSDVLDGETYHPDWPASSPYVTAVGGTDLRLTSVLADGEQAWSYGGGGFSTRAARPSWQNASVLSYLERAEGGASAGRFNRDGRGYPDVSALGGGYNAYCIALDATGWYGVYGTSASCPVVAGLVAKLNDKRLGAGMSPMGFVNPFLYANPGAFQDVIYGENKGDGFAGFRATSGWDAATGLGTPNYELLEAAAMAV